MNKEEIAAERIRILFREAGHIYDASPDRADRYVERALELGMRLRVSIPSELRRKYCHSCYSFLKPASNSRVRLKDGYVSIRCNECGNTDRYPYK